MVTTTRADLQEETIARLRQQLSGRVIGPADPDYDEARGVWNGMFDRRPQLIVQCAGAGDVADAVSFARQNRTQLRGRLSVRGGGHSVAGHATNDGGLVIDLASLNDVVVDPEACTVQVGGGARLADLDRETQKYGLAVPVGVVSETGIGGLTLGGGFGYLRNKYGLSCDNLLAAQVVLADGNIATASATENTDLFWGLRGGGGNFGIVTRFTFRAHPLGPEVFFTAVFHDGESMREMIRFYRDFSQQAPDEISSIAVCGVFPPAEIFAADLHGRPFVLFVALHCGSISAGEQATMPLRTVQTPLLDLSAAMPYLEAQTFFDEDYPAGEMRYYWKSLNLTELSDEAIDCLVEHARRQPSAHSTTDLWHIGGAVSRIGEEATAFGGRNASFLLNPEANWTDPAEDETNVDWVRAMLEAMQPFSDGSRYLNFAGFQEEGAAMMRRSFAASYPRLVSLKRKYDPTNLFSLNQNVEPDDAPLDVA